MNKVIADLFPEEIAINNWFINQLLSLFGGTVPFRVETRVLLNTTCSLEWCNFSVEIGLEEKWDAGGFISALKLAPDKCIYSRYTGEPLWDVGARI